VPVLHLLTLDLTRLHLLAAMLTLDLPGLGLLDAIAAHLLALDARRTLGTHLHALRPLRPFCAHLHALSPLGPIERGHSLSPLHTGRGHSLSPLHSRRSHLLTLSTGGCPHLNSLSASRLTVNALLSLRLSGATPIPVGPRIGRGRDRQCGDARGEKYPGHHNFSF
jgi:hypothetical protein